VLTWIKSSPRKFKPFVSARVAEIQESVDVETFKYIKSEENPADALTRGIPDNQLDEWMKGPEFLKLPDDEYLVFNQPIGENEEISETEYKKVKKPIRDIEEIQ
jgi:hypothetical protein